MQLVPSVSFLALVLCLSGHAYGASYSVSDTFQGNTFFDDFTFEAIADPTHGLVNYVDQSTAKSLGLATVSGSNFILRADSTTKLTNGAGRKSVRIQSNKQWNKHVSVYNVLHMPQGCGTWPAIWENGNNWPNGGEIDILEGVNDVVPDLVSLHTSPGCTMPSSRSMTGTATSLDCNTAVNGNSGCGAHVTDANSYGPAFNSNGGGFYAMERTSSFIKVWFWARNDGSVPDSVKNGAGTINTDQWGTPDAYFPNTSCDVNSKFGPANVIINLTFCGDWAGSASVYSSSGCPSTCTDFVSNNPSAFNNAYFEFAWIKIYQ